MMSKRMPLLGTQPCIEQQSMANKDYHLSSTSVLVKSLILTSVAPFGGIHVKNLKDAGEKS